MRRLKNTFNIIASTHVDFGAKKAGFRPLANLQPIQSLGPRRSMVRDYSTLPMMRNTPWILLHDLCSSTGYHAVDPGERLFDQWHHFENIQDRKKSHQCSFSRNDRRNDIGRA